MLVILAVFSIVIGLIYGADVQKKRQQGKTKVVVGMTIGILAVAAFDVWITKDISWYAPFVVLASYATGVIGGMIYQAKNRR